jgi:hypothetical protein
MKDLFQVLHYRLLRYTSYELGVFPRSLPPHRGLCRDRYGKVLYRNPAVMFLDPAVRLLSCW